MSESITAPKDLASQYAAQVTGDLERNVNEQKRITAEISALQEQLSALERDHGVLLNMQKALGLTADSAQTTPTTAADNTTVPSPRKKAAGASRAVDGQDGESSASTGSRPAARKGSASRSAAKTAAARPTLVGLVRSHLSEQSEPRSAAEISTALGQAHPERGIKATVVRTTLEGLVAKGQAQRTKQGNSVYYTAPDPADPSTISAAGPQSEPDNS